MIRILGKLYTLLKRPQEGEDATGDSPIDRDSPGNGATEAGNHNASTCVDEEHMAPPTQNGPDTAAQSTAVIEGLDSSCEMVKVADPTVAKLMSESTASGEWEHITSSATAGDMPGKELNLGVSTQMTDSTASGGWEHVQPQVCDRPKASAGSSLLATDNQSSSPADGGATTPITSVASTTPDTGSGTEPAINSQETEPLGPKSIDTESPEPKAFETADKPSGDQEEGKKERRKKKDKKKKLRPCKYFKMGKRCYSGNACPFLHERKQAQHVSEEGADLSGPDVTTVIVEADFPSYTDFVLEMTRLGRIINAKDLFYKLGYQQHVDRDQMERAIIGQHKLAKSRSLTGWMREARYYAELFFSPSWIDEHLAVGEPKFRNKNKKTKQCVKDYVENPSGMCKDVRLRDNPDIEKVVSNAAGDRPLTLEGQGHTPEVSGGGDAAREKQSGTIVEELCTDYTEEVIQQAMKMAISGGLSESMIMEVIDDVTSTRLNAPSSDTPRKRAPLTPVNLSRVPRQRPDQLAMGFNYHSDVVVKESPRTVKGEILLLDQLPSPREKCEQLAVGFNYLADQLVKSSPRTETGEVVIPGVVMTPRRRARDQLAVGFNYHSEVIAKDNSTLEPEEDKENMKSSKYSSKEVEKTMNDKIKKSAGVTQPVCDTGKVQSGKKLFQDTFAVGFSYNSDLMVKESLTEINGNIGGTDAGFVCELIEDASLGEARNSMENLVEVGLEDCPAPTGRLPAGSVW